LAARPGKAIRPPIGSIGAVYDDGVTERFGAICGRRLLEN
jgi:hypothetical protein